MWIVTLAPMLITADLAALASAAVLAVADPATHTELASVGQPQARACVAEVVDVPGGVRGSGGTALRITGRDARGKPCVTWAVAQVRVERQVAFTTRAIDAGGALAGAFELRTIDVKQRAPWRVPPAGAVASRALPAGTALLEHHFTASPPPGTPVRVSVSSGTLAITTRGQVAACARTDAPDTVCAVLGNGRRVRGSFDRAANDGGSLQVVMP